MLSRFTALMNDVPCRWRRHMVRILLCLSAVTAPFTAMSAGDEAALAELDQQFAGIDTLQADVRQLIIDTNGEVLEESLIRFMMKRPDGFYWETLGPWPSIIVTDGETLWHYEPDLWQLTIDDWNAGEAELAARLLSGQTAALGRDYEVRLHEASTGHNREFLLTPRDPGSPYRQISLYFEGGQLSSIDVAQSNGQQTFWEFSNLRRNERLDDDLFHFSLPDDVDTDTIDVLDNREPAPAQ